MHMHASLRSDINRSNYLIKPVIMKPNIGITDKHLKSTVEMLSALLSDEMTLYIKTRK